MRKYAQTGLGVLPEPVMFGTNRQLKMYASALPCRWEVPFSHMILNEFRMERGFNGKPA
ncbi:protein of unknown function [Pseudodesulfovibrio profundus]|uniref:Uncharacterized protein n=1 Tax=Pseudodesulfovibrio profundus TaxID=57320 RepID=A0A2C8F7H4_9BACT|nr:protein of unknown function [Pseudodesulfovibrio profundus]